VKLRRAWSLPSFPIHLIMSIRPTALEWLAKHHRISAGRIITSRFYAPEESWTGDDAWWIQVPLKAIEQGEELHFVCQQKPPGGGFHYLRVPAEFMRDRLDEFAIINGSHVNLFLDAAGALFTDRRGFGAVSFAKFEVG
jgi:hypothetical protein